MMKFNITPHCLSSTHCGTCRDREAGRVWRVSLGKAFELPPGAPDFECPHGKPWGFKGQPFGNSEQLAQSPPGREPVTGDKRTEIMVRLRAVASADVVRRLATCASCPKFTVYATAETSCEEAGGAASPCQHKRILVEGNCPLRRF